MAACGRRSVRRLRARVHDPAGDPVDPRNFHRDFKSRAHKAGFSVVPIHSTRQTCASLLVALDVHPRLAMTGLRLSRIALTMGVYSQIRRTVRPRR